MDTSYHNMLYMCIYNITTVAMYMSKRSKRDNKVMHAVNGVAVMSLGLRLVFLAMTVLTLLLIMAGDVETNPGPQTAGEQ